MVNTNNQLPVAAPQYDGWLSRLFRINKRPVVRLYHGYGDNDRMLVMGHVLLHSPDGYEDYGNGLLRNAASLLRLFMVKPAPGGIKVIIRVGEETVETQTSDDGFFMADWDTTQELAPGWHNVTAALAADPRVSGEGKVYVPPPTGWCFVSDVDDTFLLSYSATKAKRLWTILSANARTRRAFPGVVQHYRRLSLTNTTPEAPHPFFYVSSSEWNLYDFLKEFCRYKKMPEGVFLLGQIKQLSSFWNSGQGSHAGKYIRIARILDKFPKLDFVLLGDDSQQDPQIYQKLVHSYPGRIRFVYIRHRVKSHLAATREAMGLMENAGVGTCYFTHSKAALAHSVSVGLAVEE